MHPTRYLPSNTRYHRPVRNVLRLIFLSCLFLISLGEVIAQDYFYYYKGRKQKLELNTEFIYLVTSSEIADSQKLSETLDENAIVSKFSPDNSPQTVNRVSKTGIPQEFWAEIQVRNRLSAEGYLNYLKSFKGKSGVQLAAPYFKDADGSKVGISQYFYVKLKREKDFERLDKMAREANVVIVGQNKFMPLWYTLKCTSRSALNALENANHFYESGFFEFAEPDRMVENMLHAPNDPQYANQWGLNNTGLYTGTAGVDINAENAWNITKGSREVVVAVLDHGFEMNHPDLQGNTFGTGFNTGTGTSPAQVLGSHGTACAGIIAASQDNNVGVSGVAPNARLMSVSNPLVLSPTVMQELADGINWSWQNGAHVISNSWGHNSLASALIDNAITNALTMGRGGLGTIVVFSAGNGNGSVKYPANSNADIIAVGAMSQCAERKSPASCDGENWGSDFGAELDVVAPGVLISTTDRQAGSGYNPGTAIHPLNGGTLVATDFADQSYTIWFNGTSSACPMVAGVAALILSVNPCLTHDQVEDIIEQTAQKVGTYTYNMTVGRPNGTWHNEMGYGLVDAEAAVQQAIGMLPTLSGFDLFSKDRPFDTGIEPNPDAGPMWITEDIWVRQNLDGGLSHQNPEYKMFSPNGVYVKITNRGTAASTCANVSLYFTKASTGLVWPIHWEDYFQATSAGSILHGDKINTVFIPALAPGASHIVEIPWFPPNPADFDIDIHHFCLLSRIESPSDPMFDEQLMVGVGGNVKKNNNIVWKNVSVFNANISDEAIGLFVRGTSRKWDRIHLRFLDRGFQEKIRTPFFERGGAVIVNITPEFMERLKEAKLTDIEMIDEKTLLVTSPKAAIEYLPVNIKETFPLSLYFKVDLQDGEETILDVVQQNAETGELEGGERFVIQAGKEQDPIIHSLVADDNSIAYPNPANGELFIRFKVESDSDAIEATLQSILNKDQQVRLFKGNKDRGNYVDKYSVRHLPKGIYVLTVKIGDKVTTERVVIE